MTDRAEDYRGYIRDVAYLLRERAAEAGIEKEQSGSAFDEGREFGLRQALSMMQNQADVFEIPRAEVCLDGFDAMVGPVGPPPLPPLDS